MCQRGGEPAAFLRWQNEVLKQALGMLGVFTVMLLVLMTAVVVGVVAGACAAHAPHTAAGDPACLHHT